VRRGLQRYGPFEVVAGRFTMAAGSPSTDAHDRPIDAGPEILFAPIVWYQIETIDLSGESTRTSPFPVWNWPAPLRR
jgi:hypothetical protein